MHDGSEQRDGGGGGDAATAGAEVRADSGIKPDRLRLRQSSLGILVIPLIIIFGYLALYEHGPMARAFHALRYPFQLDNVEGYLLDEAIQISQGRLPYAPIHEEPYLVGNYPPLYQALWAIALRFSDPMLFHGRMLALMGMIGTALCVLMISLRVGKQLLPALLAPFLFLVTYEVHNWAAYARVDLLALFLSLLGLVCFITEDTRTARRLALLFFVLGMLAKQTAVVAPAACVLFLLARNWRRGLHFAAWLTVGMALPTLILTLATGGQYWLHTVTYNANVMEWDKVWKVWLPHLWTFYCFCLIALAAALGYVALLGVLALSRQRSEQSETGRKDYSDGERLGLVALYFGLAALTVLTLAKAGSAENYLLEPLAAAAIFIGSVLGYAQWRSANIRRTYGARTAALIILGLLFAHTHWLINGSLGGMPAVEVMFWRSAPSLAHEQRGFELGRAIYRTNGPVVAEDPIFLILAKRRPLINPFILSQLAREKIWNQQPFLDDIISRRFAMIVATVDFSAATSFDRYTDEMAEAIRQNYVLADTYDLGRDGQMYFAYRPKLRKTRVLNVVNGGRGAQVSPSAASATGETSPVQSASAARQPLQPVT